MRFSSSMNACASARLAEPARSSTRSRSPPWTIRRERPVTSATISVPKRCTDLIERALHGGERCEPLDQAVAVFDSIAALHRLAVAIDRPGGELPLLSVKDSKSWVGVRQIVEDVFARRNVHLHVAPIPRSESREPALHQRLAGRNDLMIAARPASRSRSIAPIRVGVFIEVIRCEKNRCLADLKARARRTWPGRSACRARR